MKVRLVAIFLQLCMILCSPPPPFMPGSGVRSVAGILAASPMADVDLSKLEGRWYLSAVSNPMYQYLTLCRCPIALATKLGEQVLASRGICWNVAAGKLVTADGLIEKLGFDSFRYNSLETKQLAVPNQSGHAAELIARSAFEDFYIVFVPSMRALALLTRKPTIDAEPWGRIRLFLSQNPRFASMDLIQLPYDSSQCEAVLSRHLNSPDMWKQDVETIFKPAAKALAPLPPIAIPAATGSGESSLAESVSTVVFGLLGLLRRLNVAPLVSEAPNADQTMQVSRPSVSPTPPIAPSHSPAPSVPLAAPAFQHRAPPSSSAGASLEVTSPVPRAAPVPAAGGRLSRASVVADIKKSNAVKLLSGHWLLHSVSKPAADRYLRNCACVTAQYSFSPTVDLVFFDWRCANKSLGGTTSVRGQMEVVGGSSFNITSVSIYPTPDPVAELEIRNHPLELLVAAPNYYLFYDAKREWLWLGTKTFNITNTTIEADVNTYVKLLGISPEARKLEAFPNSDTSCLLLNYPPQPSPTIPSPTP